MKRHDEKKLRLLVVSGCDSLASIVYSSLLLNQNFEIVCVARTRLSFSRKLMLITRALKAKSAKYALYMQLEILLGWIFLWRQKPGSHFLGYSRDYGTPVCDVSDLKGSSLKPLIGRYKPDLIFSIRPGLIFKRSAIVESPPIVNIHCSKLPRHGGIGGVLQALAANDDELGVTFHLIDSEHIDAGPIVAQETMSVAKGQSVFYHTLRLYQRAAQMTAVWKVRCDNDTVSWEPIDNTRQDPSYNSWPTKDVYSNLRQHGRALIYLRDFFHCWKRPSDYA